ncbi:MAG: holo-ACP synthase [Propionibacteriales bacterium]|nr:holo-ACP synthase [Propionibacteriales bacterium]
MLVTSDPSGAAGAGAGPLEQAGLGAADAVAPRVDVLGADVLGAGVIGVGVDLVHVPSFAEQLELAGSRFAGVFTPGERRDAADRAAGHGGGPGRHLAVRWAAKEALVTAWSASLFGEPPVMGDEALRQVEVVCDAWGRPRLRLLGAVARHLPDVRSHLSLTHDTDHALAYVLLTH